MQKVQKISTVEEYENYDLKRKRKVTADAAKPRKSAEARTSIRNEHSYDLLSTSSSNDPREERYAETKKERIGLKGNQRATVRHKASIEVIDIDDRSSEIRVPEFPEFPVHKFIRKRAQWCDAQCELSRFE